MKRVAALIVVTLAAFAMAAMQPWQARECRPPECSFDTGPMIPMWWDLLFFAVYLGFFGSILIAILVGVLGLRDVNAPREVAVMAALGRTRAQERRAAVRTALRTGGVGLALVYVGGGIAHTALLIGTGHPVLTTQAELWWNRALVLIPFLAALILAHVIDVMRGPSSPVRLLLADAEPDRVPRPSFAARGAIVATVFALAAGVLIGVTASVDPATAAGEPMIYMRNAAGISLFVAWASAIVFALWAGIPWARSQRSRVLGAMARLTRGAGNEPLAAVLDARAGQSSRATGRIIAVLGSFAFLIAAAASQGTAPELSDRFLGVATYGGDPDAAAIAREYEAVPGVGAVIIASAIEVPQSEGGSEHVLAVSPSDLRGVDETLSRLLRENPQAIVSSLWNGQPRVLIDDTVGLETAGVVEIENCCEAWINADALAVTPSDVAILLWATEGAGINATSEALTAVIIDDPGVTFSSSSFTGSNSGNSMVVVLLNMVILALIVGVPMAALSVGIVRRRQRDDATLAALGASARTLRNAVIIEATAVAGFAIGVGLAMGAVTRGVMSTLSLLRRSLDGLITKSPVMSGIGSIAWDTILIVGLVGLTVFAVSAAIAAFAAYRRLPAEVELRSHQGVLS